MSDEKKESKWSISNFAKKIISSSPLGEAIPEPKEQKEITPNNNTNINNNSINKESSATKKPLPTKSNSFSEITPPSLPNTNEEKGKTVTSGEGMSIEEIILDSPFTRQKIVSFENDIEKTTSRIIKLSKLAKQIHQSLKGLHQLQHDFSQELISFGGTHEDEEVENLFKVFGKSLEEVEAVQNIIAEQMNNLVANPLEEFTKETGETKKEKKKKYEKSLHTFESSLSKAMQTRKKSTPQQKLIEVETELFISRKNYHVTTWDYVNSLNIISKDQKLKILENLSNYMYAYSTYFSHGTSLMKDRESLINQASTLCLKKKKEKTALGAQFLLGSSSEQVISQTLNSFLTKTTEVSPQKSKSEKKAQKEKVQNQTKSGYLWMKSASVMHDWKRRFVEISDHTLKIFKANQSAPIVSVLTLLCSPKECPDERLYTFEISTPEETHHFVAESEIDMKNWITVLHNSTFSALNAQVIPEKKYFNNDLTGTSPSTLFNNDRSTREFVQDPLSILRKHSKENNSCADCGAHHPEWASINLGILICIQCSGSHRSMGTHISKIRSFTLDKCDESLLNAMLAIGNKKANAIFESRQEAVQKWKTEKKFERDLFIKEKYVERSFIQPSSLSKEELGLFLFEQVTKDDPYEVLSAIIQGADINFQHKDHLNQTPLHHAIEKGFLICAYYLIVHRASLNHLDENGQTPLHYAALNNDIEATALLFKSGIQLDIKDKSGRTALDVAAENQKADCLTLLRLAQLSIESGTDEFTEAFESFSKSSSRLQKEKILKEHINDPTIPTPLVESSTTQNDHKNSENNNNRQNNSDHLSDDPASTNQKDDDLSHQDSLTNLNQGNGASTQNDLNNSNLPSPSINDQLRDLWNFDD